MPLEIYWNPLGRRASTIKNHCSIWTSSGTDWIFNFKGYWKHFYTTFQITKILKSEIKFTLQLYNFISIVSITMSLSPSPSALYKHGEKSNTYWRNFLCLNFSFASYAFHRKHCEWVFLFLGRVAESEVKCSSPTLPPSFKEFPTLNL